MVFALAAALGAGASTYAAAPAQNQAHEQTGTFALLGSTPKIVSKFWATPRNGTPQTTILHVRQFQPGGTTPIVNYDVEMQKTIHLIAIRDDFASFAHLHPAFNTTTGTFSESFAADPGHRYYVYADTQPHGIGQQVFRFTLDADGAPVAASRPSLAASAPTAVAGPYTVTLAKTTLAANQSQGVDLTVKHNGHPATDLGSYLGAPAHCVFINTTTLAYVHIHPTVRNGMAKSGSIEMNMTGAAPLMQLHVPALPANTYKLWIQFRGGNYKLYTVPFTIVER
jgi:hypothetical protein